MAKLKVFAAPLGFYETVVAAPSRKAALAAWGARQDLFGQGVAVLAEDPGGIEAALAAPGVVLRRPVGSQGAFEHDADLGGLRLPAGKTKGKSKAKAAQGKPAQPPPDRSALTAAEAALSALDAGFQRAQQDMADRREALDAEAAALRAAYQRDRKPLDAARETVAAAYRKASRGQA